MGKDEWALLDWIGATYIHQRHNLRILHISVRGAKHEPKRVRRQIARD
jgi:hypothetical protein